MQAIGPMQRARAGAMPCGDKRRCEEDDQWVNPHNLYLANTSSKVQTFEFQVPYPHLSQLKVCYPPP